VLASTDKFFVSFQAHIKSSSSYRSRIV